MFAVGTNCKTSVIETTCSLQFQEDLPKGTILHFAFEVNEVDAYIKLCNQNDYEIFMGPKDLVLVI